MVEGIRRWGPGGRAGSRAGCGSRAPPGAPAAAPWSRLVSGIVLGALVLAIVEAGPWRVVGRIAEATGAGNGERESRSATVPTRQVPPPSRKRVAEGPAGRERHGGAGPAGPTVGLAGPPAPARGTSSAAPAVAARIRGKAGARTAAAPSAAGEGSAGKAAAARSGAVRASVSRGAFGGKVVGVSDGDTITVLRSTSPRTARGSVRGPGTGAGSASALEIVKVRLEGIDCPELRQAFGRRAKERPSSLAFGREVRVEVGDLDRYERRVARVVLPDGRDLSEELVRSGLAWWYRKYSEDPELEALEAEARKARRGLWADRASSRTPPWEYRGEARLLRIPAIPNAQSDPIRTRIPEDSERRGRPRTAWLTERWTLTL